MPSRPLSSPPRLGGISTRCSLVESTLLSTRHDVRIGPRNTLDTLYHHSHFATLEYPETSGTGKIGHLFDISPDDFHSPRLSFTYSQGSPSGRTTAGKHVYCTLLRDDNGELVPCQESHYTCQGSKVCPEIDLVQASQPHTRATREALKFRLQQSQQLSHPRSAQRALFEKTLSLFRSYRTAGCLGPADSGSTPRRSPDDSDEDDEDVRWQAQTEKNRRGHAPKRTCNGRIILDHDHTGRAFVWYISEGLFDLDYLEALFDGDDEVIAQFELAARDNGFGPLLQCTTVRNNGTNKVYCPNEHRDSGGRLVLASLTHLSCKSTFRCFEPLEPYRRACPRVLVVCQGAHTHPIPLPIKTPPAIRAEVIELLETLDQDLPDITPRRFIRHPVVFAYLRKHLPTLTHPTLADLHISLANREHLKAFINQVQLQRYPHETGWKGLIHLKEIQDERLPPHSRYIRHIEEIPAHNICTYEEDDLDAVDPRDNVKPIRIVICMDGAASHRLALAQFLQSDIAFKWVTGFFEFEIGGLDRGTNIAVTYCRVYVNRQSAAAHALIFRKIEDIVRQDTGQQLKWRHLDADSEEDHCGILQWMGDQHRGQAKGLGLHLQSRAALLPPDRRDIYEPHRALAALSDYDHLRRIFRLCSLHAKRNIKTTAVSDSVKNKMRSLICMTHPNFEGCLEEIVEEGGKAGADWVHDKLSAKFAFPGMCWSQSFIPKVVWQIGDSTSNIVESLHSDVNKEGVACTLVGGIRKGQHFDQMKLQTLQAVETAGVRPSYKTGHSSENILRGVKRDMNARIKTLISQDVEIESANKKLKANQDNVYRADVRLANIESRTAVQPANPSLQQQMVKAVRSQQTAATGYAKALEASTAAVGKGTGRVLIALPPQVAETLRESRQSRR
ncbi:hypothetical protein FIBSPDRAFT_768547 [Athelia psychrophila]|uniref:Uncharacterized protein n=1 Tax=Athelia psychrophila TaxID=1759441 RepID=A0A167U929_9AGAM|nr:hypothetical protein FIBSPDRAFT_768547 [Fibularhizoctonia sp. CBS 109695]